jgi:NAD(P)-dependent dehydrogenase (short-subunit alcohol dehydrogenase family)
MTLRMASPMAIASDTTFGLSGKRAVITGATSGMGLAIARAFAQHGADTIISSFDAGDVRETVAVLASDGLEVSGTVCDLSSPEGVRSFPATITDEFGPIDILIAHATPFAPTGPIERTTRDELDRLFNGVLNNFELMRGFLPLMSENGGGSIVTTSSIASVRASISLGAYGAGKAATDGFVRSIAAEWGSRGIRINSIAPSIVRTPFSVSVWDDDERSKTAADKTALGRIAEPEEVVGAVLLFASPAGSYITGQTLLIDGGRSIL